MGIRGQAGMVLRISVAYRSLILCCKTAKIKFSKL